MNEVILDQEDYRILQIKEKSFDLIRDYIESAIDNDEKSIEIDYLYGVISLCENMMQ